MPPNGLPIFQALSGVYEPSGIQQLADGRFLVVEDEQRHALSLLGIRDGQVSHTALNAPFWSWGNDDFWKLDDLEGVTADRAGNIYAITSHSRDSDGNERKSRERLVRFRIEGDQVVDPRVVGNLKRHLIAAHPELAAYAAIREVKREGGLNIEALEMSADQRRLLMGFRSPLLDGRAIIASIENPGALFDADERPRIGVPLTTLDLGGNGIRGLSWVPDLAGYLVIAGPVARERLEFQLWFWRGGGADRPRRVSVAGLPGFEHAEGVSPAVIDGRKCIILVSDDGSRDEGRCARFLILRPDQLRIAD
ncbi:MAG: DUF3616 domain-containing protein [Candidatus Accumulibacter sp.]|uniref:DUF3616 domain-containing protein n=1 Tax=Accumulibacter sp. TaxID=2053492 RepID=UPI00258C27C5|nr:DUF3616 domain-containing protein [Accumulibacter sp.]MCM8621786.1 DUF3616 domain-containing protein [Accumulibacter sp.]